MSPENDLFEIYSPALRHSLWVESSPVVIWNAVMLQYKPEIIRYWKITNITEGYLIQWTRRPIPLTDKELSDFFPDYKFLNP